MFIGSVAEARNFRDTWIEQAQPLACELGLPHRVAPSSDPFFGRTGQMMAVSQLQQSLLVPMRAGDPPTACMSFNYHLDHFGTTWGSA